MGLLKIVEMLIQWIILFNKGKMSISEKISAHGDSSSEVVLASDVDLGLLQEYMKGNDISLYIKKDGDRLEIHQKTFDPKIREKVNECILKGKEKRGAGHTDQDFGKDFLDSFKAINGIKDD